jgi:hypothetical protein
MNKDCIRVNSMVETLRLLAERANAAAETIDKFHGTDKEPDGDELSPIEAVDDVNDHICFFADVLRELETTTNVGYNCISIVRKPL